MKSKRTIALIFFFILMCGILSSQEAVKFSNYSFTIPSGWILISEAENIKETIRLKTELNISLPKFDFALRKENSINTFDRPFIIIRTNSDGKISQNDLNQIIQLDYDTLLNAIQSKLQHSLKEVYQIEGIVDRSYDKEKKIIYTTLKGYAEGLGNTIQIQGWVLTETGYIQILGSLLADNISNDIDAFFKLTNSLTVKDKYKSVIINTKNPVNRSYFFYAIVIIIIIGTYLLNKKLSKRK
jgi:glycyl-tRNA synthetase alpha subunit